jgi:hypothetical protein
MTSQVVPVNVQVPSDPRWPIVADFAVHALRGAYLARRDFGGLPEDEWGVPGAYVRFTDDGSRQVYVGQAVNLRKRLLQDRRAPKLDWVQAVAIKRHTTHGFNSAEIEYLEGRLAVEIGAIAGITVVEGLRSQDAALPPHHMLALDEFLGSVLAAQRLGGLGLLNDADLQDDDPTTDGGSRHGNAIIPGTVADLASAGLLRAGVQLHLAQGGRTGNATVTTAGELVVNGVAYATPSNAAATALGLQSSNGWTTWHVGDLGGPTLRAFGPGCPTDGWNRDPQPRASVHPAPRGRWSTVAATRSRCAMGSCSRKTLPQVSRITSDARSRVGRSTSDPSVRRSATPYVPSKPRSASVTIGRRSLSRTVPSALASGDR